MQRSNHKLVISMSTYSACPHTVLYIIEGVYVLKLKTHSPVPDTVYVLKLKTHSPVPDTVTPRYNRVVS